MKEKQVKKVWIINHNATPPQMSGLARHFYFSKYLRSDGYNVRIITASTIHNTKINMITDKSLYLEKEIDEVPYTFLRCGDYSGNGLARIKNILQFPLRVWQVYKKFETPDIIYASSPDPLSAASAILLAKHLRVPCVLEVRDLWPESIVCYTEISRRNPVIIALYQLEKWMYKHADHLVFTSEGGGEYIKDHKWDNEQGGPIDLKKVSYLNNGIDLCAFELENQKKITYHDDILDDDSLFKIVYSGSIRQANRIDMLIDIAEKMRDTPNVVFVIFGDGTERAELEKRCEISGLRNVFFRGHVSKETIYQVLPRAQMFFLEGNHTPLMKYGCSPNKLFDYLASGKPVFSFLNSRYDIIDRYKCGVNIPNNDIDLAKKIILDYVSMDKTAYQLQCKNALLAAKEYDYRALTNQLKSIIDKMIE